MDQQQLLQRLDALAAKLGTTAQGIWKIYLAQARVDVIEDMVGVILAGVLASLTLTIGRALMRKGSDGAEFAAILVWIFGGVAAFILFACCVSDAVTPIFNPQYWAFHQLMQDIFGR